MTNQNAVELAPPPNEPLPWENVKPHNNRVGRSRWMRLECLCALECNDTSPTGRVLEGGDTCIPGQQCCKWGHDGY